MNCYSEISLHHSHFVSNHWVKHHNWKCKQCILMYNFGFKRWAASNDENISKLCKCENSVHYTTFDMAYLRKLKSNTELQQQRPKDKTYFNTSYMSLSKEKCTESCSFQFQKKINDWLINKRSLSAETQIHLWYYLSIIPPMLNQFWYS